MSSHSENSQALAFSYLRDTARSAHLEGDGLKVNSLCALALVHILDRANRQELQLSVQELRWAFIFPHLWLVDDYMLRTVREALESFAKRGEVKENLYQFLQAYLYLVEQPLAPIEGQVTVLTSIRPVWLMLDCQLEDSVMLRHIIELVWYRAPTEGAWRSLADSWASGYPSSLCGSIADLRTRLDVQTKLTVPSTRQPRIEAQAIASISPTFPFAKLWGYLLHCDGPSLDRTVVTMNGTTPSESYAARLLFDFHHCNRFYGYFGEPQAIGLTRRRLFNESSPVLTFTDVRKAHLSETIGRLHRADKVGQAEARFHAFRLSMLCELAALALWDWAAWRDAIKAQAETHLELCKWETASPELPATSIRLLVQCLEYKGQHEDALTRNAFDQLEFAPPTVLSVLVESLLSMYPVQMPGAYEVLEDLGDLIPEQLWTDVARWCLAYAKAQRAGLRFGPSSPLQFWKRLFPFVSEDSSLWDLLLPEMLLLAAKPNNWVFMGTQLYVAWLVHAPKSSAKALGDVLLTTRTNDQVSIDYRRYILLTAEQHRKEFSGCFWPQLIPNQPELAKLDFIHLVPFTEATEIKAAAKAVVVRQLRAFIAQSTPPADRREFTLGPTSHMRLDSIEWIDDDLPLLDELISAIDSPQVLAQGLAELLLCLRSLVGVGPASFAEATFERFTGWLSTPPKGRDIRGAARGPFSAVQIGDENPTVSVALGYLSLEMARKLGSRADSAITAWLRPSALERDLTAIPIMFNLGIEIALRTEGSAQRELITMCDNMLLELWSLRTHDGRSNPALAQALRYLDGVLGEDLSLQPARRPETDKQALEQLVVRLPTLLAHFARSSHGGVRAAVAALLTHLERRHSLSEPLERVLAALAQDNRAGVRFAARTGGRKGSSGNMAIAS